MRPTISLSRSAAAALAVSLLAAPVVAQDAPARRDREVTIVPGMASGLRGLRIGGRPADRDRAVLGVSLATGRGRGDTLGVRIADVTTDGPAAKAGIEEGDRITAIDGTSLRIDAADADDPALADLGYRRLQRALAKHKPGDEVSLTLARGRETRAVRVKTVAADELPTATRAIMFGDGQAMLNGISVRSMADSARARGERRPALGLTVGPTGNKRDTLGLFVSGVAADGPAERAGLIEGARIASIGGVDVRVSKDDLDDPEIASVRARRFTRELEKHLPGDDIALRVWQNGAYRSVTVKAAKSSDVYKGRTGFAYSFGDGDGLMIPPMPPMPAMAPRAPMPPAAPSARMLNATPRMIAIPSGRRMVHM